LRAATKKNYELAPYYHCKKNGVSFAEICRDTECPWFLNRETFLNCTWVACNFGPFTLEEIGSMMGITRERVRQIQVKALKRLQHRKRKERLRDFWEESDRHFRQGASLIAGGGNDGYPKNGNVRTAANIFFREGEPRNHWRGGQSEDGGGER